MNVRIGIHETFMKTNQLDYITGRDRIQQAMPSGKLSLIFVGIYVNTKLNSFLGSFNLVLIIIFYILTTIVFSISLLLFSLPQRIFRSLNLSIRRGFNTYMGFLVSPPNPQVSLQ
jgi:hypothetical protein